MKNIFQHPYTAFIGGIGLITFIVMTILLILGKINATDYGAILAGVVAFLGGIKGLLFEADAKSVQ